MPNILINRRVILKSNGFPFDTDALNYINAVGNLSFDQKIIANTLFADLKTAGLYNKMIAFYPYMGGLASTHKYNAKNPIDSDVAFRLTFYGGLTHSANGILPNGINGYADTHLNMPSSGLGVNASIGIYCNVDDRTNGNFIDVGCYDNVSLLQINLLRGTDTAFYFYGFDESPFINTDTKGFNLMTRSGALLNKYFYKNGIQKKNTASPANSLTGSYSVYLFSRNTTGTSGFYSNKGVAFHTFSDYLNASEQLTLYNIIQNFQTSLGRQV